ncbi:unnamed protein product [Closterium sp. NIES-64]|nr:unnamed protein product [Closterium sp. NIES-64]CAI5991918.1 unnamed protein product [Closterium sp. NIES-65]
MADVSPRHADSRPAAANAAAASAPSAPTWFLTVHTQRALKRRHSEQDERDERDERRDERDARRSTYGDDPSRLMSLMLANSSSSAHPARPCSSAHPTARPRANDDGAVAGTNPSPRPLASLAGPATSPSAFSPSAKPTAFAGLGSHGRGLAPIRATPASVPASHASPASFPPTSPALFSLRHASIPRGALPELLLPRGHKTMHRKSMQRKGMHHAQTSAASTRNGGNGRRKGSGGGARNGGGGNVSKNKGCSSSSGDAAVSGSGGVRHEVPSPARCLKRCKVAAADVDAAAQQKLSERPSAKRNTTAEGSTPGKASPPTPPVTPSNEEVTPASWAKAGLALEPSGPVDKGLLTLGTAVLCEGHAVESGGEMASPTGEHGDVGMVGEPAVGESGGACEGQMREQLMQAIKERLAQAQLLQARLLQTRQALQPHGGSGHTSCSATNVAPRSPPALVLGATQNKCSQGKGALMSCSPAAIAACSPAAVAACSPTALSTTAGPVCAADLNLPPADVAGGMESEAVVVESEDADLALAAMAIECEVREARGLDASADLEPASDECMGEADTPRTAPTPGCSAHGKFPGTACPAGQDAHADAFGNARGNALDAVFLFACNLGAEKVSGANDVFAANSSKLDGADSRAGCIDLTLHL